MSKKSHIPGPIPPGNRPHAGGDEPGQDESGKTAAPTSPAGQEQDPKRRLGDFTGTGEHARQQPGPLNDGGSRHGEDRG